jgi:O-6-methylguanine DNA methyltransferase
VSAGEAPFARRVLAVVRRIPVGRVTTYGDVARLAGRPGAARAVGNVLRDARQPGLPYHRVIAAGGQLGGYSNLALKRSLLAAEGLVVTPRRVRHFSDVRWP